MGIGPVMGPGPIRMAQERVIVNFDGSSEPVNPGGVATFGFVISKDDHILAKEHVFLAEGRGASNNSAEYGGLIGSRYFETGG